MNHPKNCLVTGAAGFIGSHLCDRLLNLGHQVTGLDSLIVGNLKNLQQAQKSAKFTFIHQDVAEVNPTILEGIDWVFHLAGLADLVPDF